MSRSIVDAADQERSRRKDEGAPRTAEESFEELRLIALRVKRDRDELLAALREIADGRVMLVKDIADTAAWRLAEVVVEYQRIASEAIARAETP